MPIIGKEQSANARASGANYKDPFNLFYEKKFLKDKENISKNIRDFGQAILTEDLKQHPQFSPLDKKIVLDSMRSMFHMKVDVQEVHFVEFARRTKQYFFNYMINALIGRYTLALRDLADFLYRNYYIILTLESTEQIEDMIEGIYQIY